MSAYGTHNDALEISVETFSDLRLSFDSNRWVWDILYRGMHPLLLILPNLVIDVQLFLLPDVSTKR